MNYKVTAVATHEAGADPVTNLGNPADASKKIAAGTKSATSGSITGFRSFFYGTKLLDLILMIQLQFDSLLMETQELRQIRNLILQFLLEQNKL